MHAPINPTDANRIIGEHMLVRDHYDFVMDLEKSHGPFLVDAREEVRDAQGNVRRLSEQERTLLDFYTQFASWPISYNHPDLVEDQEFLATLRRVSINKIANSDVVTIEQAAFVQAMHDVAIHDGLDYMFVISGGALAVENALKASFDWKIRLNFARGILHSENDYKVIHFREAFHGRTGYTMSLTNTDPDKTRFFPKFAEWPRVTNPKVTFPIEAHLADIEKLEARAIAEIEEAIARNPHTIAALILETVQGEGGDSHFRPEFFQKLRQLTEQHDILLILDEVQAGCGLTGKFWAYQHTGIVPDIISFGKKMQVCGILANRKKFDRVEAHCFKTMGRLNSTWGSDLVDMVRATQLLRTIQKRGYVENAARQGEFLLAGLKELEREFSAHIFNARGLGLMTAFDFHDPALRNRYVQEMRRNHVLALSCGPRTTRLRPMLDIERQHIQLYLDAAAKSLHAITK